MYVWISMYRLFTSTQTNVHDDVIVKTERAFGNTWMLLLAREAILKFYIEWIYGNLCNPLEVESETAIIVRSRAYGIQSKYGPVIDIYSSTNKRTISEII